MDQFVHRNVIVLIKRHVEGELVYKGGRELRLQYTLPSITSLLYAAVHATAGGK